MVTSSLSVLRPPAEAEALFRDNWPLAMWALRRTLRRRPDVERHLLSRMQPADAEQIAALALWRCCLHWDPRRGTLGTLVTSAVEYALAGESQRRSLPAVPLSALGAADSAPFQPPAPTTPDPLKGADDAAEVESLLARLPRRWRRIVALHYGLDGQRPHTLAQIGQRLGVSRQAVQAVEAKALEKLSLRCKHLVSSRREPTPTAKHHSGGT
jgi:RNA polymerase sigma factor (sigma-70 family)